MGNISINEIKIMPDFHSVGRKIKDLGVSEDSIIISIIRNNDVIIPTGSTIINAKDEIIAVSKKGNETKLEKILGKI